MLRNSLILAFALAGCTSQDPAGPVDEDAQTDTAEGDVVYAEDPVTGRPDEGIDTSKPDTASADTSDSISDGADTAPDAASDARDGETDI